MDLQTFQTLSFIPVNAVDVAYYGDHRLVVSVNVDPLDTQKEVSGLWIIDTQDMKIMHRIKGRFEQLGKI